MTAAPPSPDAFAEALRLGKLGRHDEAIARLDPLLRKEPLREDALALKERICEAAGRGGLALEMWSDAIRRHPSSIDYRMRRELLRLRVGDERVALGVLEELAQHRPENADAAMQAGYAARCLELDERALRWFSSAQAVRPGDDVTLEITRQLVRLERYGEAADAWATLSAATQREADARELRISLLVRLDVDAARSELRAALEEESDPIALAALAWLGTRNGLQREAIDGLQSAFIRLAHNPDVGAALGRCLAFAGESQRTREVIATIDEAKLGAEALLDLAEAWLVLADRDSFRRVVQRALELRRVASSTWPRALSDRLVALCEDGGSVDVARDVCAERPSASTPSRSTCALVAARDGRAADAEALVALDAEASDEFPADRWRARVAQADGAFAAAVGQIESRVLARRSVALQDARLWIRALIDAEEVTKAWAALQRFEATFAPRDLVEERVDLLRLDLRFEEELDCLRAAVKRDPLDETFASRLADRLLAHGLADEALPVIDAWTHRRPTARVWLHKRMTWGAAAHRNGESQLALLESMRPRVSPRLKIHHAFEHVTLLMRLGQHDEAERVLASIADDLVGLPISSTERCELEQKVAHTLTLLGRHAQARPLFDGLAASRMSQRMRDELHRHAALNESFGGLDARRFADQRNHISNPRHHVRVTEFRGATGTAPQSRVLVLLHLFHQDLWPEIRSYLQNLEGTPYQLCVGVRPEAASSPVVQDLLAFAPTARVVPVPNRGFDVGSHWELLSTVDARAFDVAMLLQTKKSTHSRIGPAWRANLMRSLMGDAARWRENLRAFAENPKLGLIGSALHQSSFHPWSYREMRDVVLALGMPTQGDALKRVQQFVTGTMFLIRASLLADMHDKTRGQLEFEPFESLPFGKRIDNTRAHAMERAFGMYALWRGFEMLWRP